MPREQARIEVLKRLPQVAKIDGDMVKPTEREMATGVASG
jgi:dynein light chain 1